MVEEEMDDLKQLREVVLERANTLADVRLKTVIWQKAKHLSLEDLLRASYLDGVRDSMDYLGQLLEDEAEA